MNDLKSRLKRILHWHVGRGSAVTARELCEQLGVFAVDVDGSHIYEDRTVRKAIEGLIDEDFPVCSVTEEPAGYFFPASVEEARAYSKSLQKRAVRIFLRRRHIIKNTALHYEPARQERLI